MTTLAIVSLAWLYKKRRAEEDDVVAADSMAVLAEAANAAKEWAAAVGETVVGAVVFVDAAAMTIIITITGI
jgi:hypothetical protein